MAHPTAPAPRLTFATARDQLARRQGLPFLALLARSAVAAACRAVHHTWRERVYIPWITLSLFLSQVLSEDHSCDEAVDRFQKARYDQGLPPVSPETTSYCDARAQLPEGLSWELVHGTGRTIQEKADPSWLFHGRSVKIVDGSTVVLPDAEPNQEAYPQPSSQAPELGFPIARLLVVFSPAVGTVLEAAMGPYQGDTDEKRQPCGNWRDAGLRPMYGRSLGPPSRRVLQTSFDGQSRPGATSVSSGITSRHTGLSGE